jgi:TfuA protein
MTNTVIFAGPSLNSSARELLASQTSSSIALLPPAQSGSIWKLSASFRNLKNIVIIDGFFYDTLSVLHREILDAIESGITVVGSSSMGALRAVELFGYGMFGYGDVYNYILEHPFVSDDEVALIHENGGSYRPYSIPLINLRILASHLSSINSADAECLLLLVDRLSSYQFERRTWTLVEQIYRSSPLQSTNVNFFARLKSNLYRDYKSTDAESLVSRLVFESDFCDKFSSVPLISKSKELPVNRLGFGIDSHFLPAKGLVDPSDSPPPYTVQHAIASLRLQGSVHPVEIARAIHKYQVSALYHTLEVPQGIVFQVTNQLLTKYNSADIAELSFVVGLPISKLTRMINLESLFRYYIKIKSDEIGVLSLNDLIFQELILDPTDFVDSALIGNIALHSSFVSTADSIAQSVDLVSGLLIFADLIQTNIKKLLKTASLTRVSDLLSLLSLMRPRF